MRKRHRPEEEGEIVDTTSTEPEVPVLPIVPPSIPWPLSEIRTYDSIDEFLAAAVTTPITLSPATRIVVLFHALKYLRRAPQKSSTIWYSPPPFFSVEAKDTSRAIASLTHPVIGSLSIQGYNAIRELVLSGFAHRDEISDGFVYLCSLHWDANDLWGEHILERSAIPAYDLPVMLHLHLMAKDLLQRGQVDAVMRFCTHVSNIVTMSSPEEITRFEGAIRNENALAALLDLADGLPEESRQLQRSLTSLTASMYSAMTTEEKVRAAVAYRKNHSSGQYDTFLKSLGLGLPATEDTTSVLYRESGERLPAYTKSELPEGCYCGLMSRAATLGQMTAKYTDPVAKFAAFSGRDQALFNRQTVRRGTHRLVNRSDPEGLGISLVSRDLFIEFSKTFTSAVVEQVQASSSSTAAAATPVKSTFKWK